MLTVRWQQANASCSCLVQAIDKSDNRQAQSQMHPVIQCLLLLLSAFESRQQAACMLHLQDIISTPVINDNVPFPDILWQRQGSPGWHGKQLSKR